MNNKLHLDLDLLRTFLTVAECKGFTCAGQLLDVSQSTVSLQIKRLEERLGQRVFKRSRRALALTHQGEILLGFARRMLELHDESVRLLTAPALEGTLRLGVTEYFFPQHFPHVIARFGRAYPQLSIAVQVGLTAELRRLQQRGELDLVIGQRDGVAGAGKLMFREPLCWVAKRGSTLERTQPVALIVLPEPCAYRELAVHLLQRAGRPWRLGYAASSILGIQAAVSAGLGIGCLPLSAVQRGMRILGSYDGLPALPDSEVALFEGAGGTDARTTDLVEIIRSSLPKFSAEAMTLSARLAEAA